MNTKGQSLIELIMVLPIFIAFWAAIVWFARVWIIEIELLHTARHGVFMMAYNTDFKTPSAVEKQFVQNECVNFLQRQDPSLALSKPPAVITGNRWKPPRAWKAFLENPIAISAFAPRLSNQFLLRRFAGIYEPLAASVEVTYSLPTPPLLRAIPGFPPNISLRGYCVCYR